MTLNKIKLNIENLSLTQQQKKLTKYANELNESLKFLDPSRFIYFVMIEDTISNYFEFALCYIEENDNYIILFPSCLYPPIVFNKKNIKSYYVLNTNTKEEFSFGY